MTKEIEERIKQLLKEKNYNEILKICKEILDTDKNNDRAYFYKGRVNYDLKQYEEAIKNYDKAIEDYDKVIEFKDKCSIAYFNRGLSKYYLGKNKESEDYKEAIEYYKEAIKDYDKAIKFNEKYSIAYFNRGLSKYSLKRYKEAIEDYDKAIKFNEKYSIAFYNRGLSKFYLKRYEEAIKDYDKAIKDYDKAIEYYKETIKDYDKAIKINEEYSIAYFNRGLSKYSLKQYKEAIEDYDKAININDKYYGTYNNRGLSKYYLGKYEESIEDYDKAININDKYYGTYNNRGLSKYYLGKNKESEDYKEAIEYYKEAIKDYDKAIDINKKYSVAYRNRGKAKFYLGKYEEAIEDYNKAINLNDKDIKNYIYIGACYLFLGEDENFIENFKKYYDLPYRKNSGISYINQTIMLLFDIDKYKIGKHKNKKSSIIKYVKKLTNNKYYEICKDDIILKNKIKENDILNLISKENNFEKILNYIKNILLYQYLLLKSLCFNNNDNIEISHYTSLNTLFLLLNDKREEKKNESRIRITNISNANDPKEGKILESIFNNNGLNIKVGNDKDLITLQTSFSRNKDSLTMFRLYGKNESNKEATGICLVVNKEYFNDEYSSPPFEMNNTLALDDKKDDRKEEQIDSGKRNLYWVLYYNEKDNLLVFNPNDSKYSNIIIDLIDLLEDTKINKNNIDIDKDKGELIKYIFRNIIDNAKKLDKSIKNNDLKKAVFSSLFEYIKYLIKDEAFFEEQELRMLVTTNYNSSNIYTDNQNKRLYIDYIKLFDGNENYIKEIILGAKIENAEAIAEYINKILNNKYKHSKEDIIISISNAPLK